MRTVADIVMILWIPLTFLMFAVLPPRRAIIAAFMVGWLFLPPVTYNLPILPDYSKATAISLSVLLGILIFDWQGFRGLRLRWFDGPIIGISVAPLLASVSNGLGLWDGVSGVVGQFLSWGVPYLAGRVYFAELTSLRELAIGIVLGGLAYAPLCWLENLIGPQLSEWVYGQSAKWSNAARFGGWRPSVFMSDGLMAALWMAVASLTATCLWRARQLPALGAIRPGVVAVLLTGTTILCRSTGALTLLAIVLVAASSLRFGTRAALAVLLATAPAYLAVRISGVWDGAHAVRLASSLDAERAASLQFRIDNEEMLVDKALLRPLFGWGGWGRSRVYDENGRDVSITDGQWIIEFGTRGLLGLASLFALLLLPLGLLLKRFPANLLVSADLAVPLAMVLGTTVFAIDCIPNGMINPVFTLMAGGAIAWGAGPSILENARSTTSSTSQMRHRERPGRRLHPGCV